MEANRTIEHVLFDLGGVMVDVKWATAWRRVARHCPGGQVGAMSRLLALGRDLQVVRHYEAGRAEWGAVTDWFRERTGFAGSDEILEDAWCSVFEENTAMTAFAAELAGGHRLFYLSNIGRKHLGFLHEHFPFMDMFQDGAASCDLGVCKPEERFFERALGELNLAPARCVFVDDREQNVDAAREWGLNAVHHTGAVETIRQLRNLLN